MGGGQQPEQGSMEQVGQTARLHVLHTYRTLDCETNDITTGCLIDVPLRRFQPVPIDIKLIYSSLRRCPLALA